MLFDRSASVVVTSPENEVTEIQGLRMQFSVIKSNTPTQNKSSVSIYNLSETNISRITKRDSIVRLNAGYLDGGGEQSVLIASVIDHVLKDPLPDRITELKLSDGSKQLRDAQFSGSFDEGVTVESILKEVASQVGLGIKELTKLVDEQFPNGFSANGAATKILDQLSEKLGVDWSIQDQELQLLADNETTGETVVDLGFDSGLLQAPRLIQPSTQMPAAAASSVKMYNMKSFLMPSIKPGDRIFVDTDKISGLFKTVNLRHDGDTHAAKWHTEFQVQSI